MNVLGKGIYEMGLGPRLGSVSIRAWNCADAPYLFIRHVSLLLFRISATVAFPEKEARLFSAEDFEQSILSFSRRLSTLGFIFWARLAISSCVLRNCVKNEDAAGFFSNRKVGRVLFFLLVFNKTSSSFFSSSERSRLTIYQRVNLTVKVSRLSMRV